MSAEYQEILTRLERIENGKPPAIPLIDPTANVLQLVAAAMARQDDLRDAESRHRDKTAELRDRLSREIREAEKKGQTDLALAESRRIDALLAAQQQSVALASARAELTAGALAERVEASAKALADRVDATAQTLAGTVEVTSKTLSERIVPLEQFRYESSGLNAQRSEGRSQNQWVVGLVLSLPSAVLALVAVVVLLTK